MYLAKCFLPRKIALLPSALSLLKRTTTRSEMVAEVSFYLRTKKQFATDGFSLRCGNAKTYGSAWLNIARSAFATHGIHIWVAGSNSPSLIYPSALLKLLQSQGLRPRSYTHIDASGKVTIVDSESKYIITELWSRQMENEYMARPHVDNL